MVSRCALTKTDKAKKKVKDKQVHLWTCVQPMHQHRMPWWHKVIEEDCSHSGKCQWESKHCCSFKVCDTSSVTSVFVFTSGLFFKKSRTSVNNSGSLSMSQFALTVTERHASLRLVWQHVKHSGALGELTFIRLNAEQNQQQVTCNYIPLILWEN